MKTSNRFNGEGASSFGIRLIVMDCVSEIFDDEKVRHFFSDLIATRLRGYGPEYPKGVLPLDVEDYIGTHVVACREQDGRYIPVMGYKFTTLGRCQEFRRTFPGIVMPRDSEAPEHVAAITRILERAQKRGNEIGYCGSWTIAPETRKDRELTRYLRDLIYTAHYFYQQDYQVPEMICAGSVRLKTDQFEEAFGYRRIREELRVLGEFAQASLWGETVVMLHCQEASALARETAMKHEEVWRSRITYAQEARLPAELRRKILQAA